MKAPLLFITFNRPDTTEQVFEKIKLAEPRKLIIASDGPREHVEGEAAKVAACREIFKHKNITWECEVTRLYSESNQGCAKGVSQAITKAFELEESLIILEDDIVPHPTFFTFCARMLDRYKHDERVMHVAGTRWNPEYNMGDADHFFSNIGHIWGWATWKRAWDKYDYNLDKLSSLKQNKTIKKLYDSNKISNFWLSNFNEVAGPNKKTWDYQWQFSLFYNQGLAVVPMVNLTSNIGTDGVHYQGRATEHHFQSLQQWIEKPEVFVEIDTDSKFELYHMNEWFLKKPPIYIRAINRIKKLTKI